MMCVLCVYDMCMVCKMEHSLEMVERLREAKAGTLGEHHMALIGNALYACKPPETSNITRVKERRPLIRYIRTLINDELSSDTRVAKVVRGSRRRAEREREQRESRERREESRERADRESRKREQKEGAEGERKESRERAEREIRERDQRERAEREQRESRERAEK